MVKRNAMERTNAVIALVAYSLLTPIFAVAAAADTAPPPTDTCKATVLRFERALAIMRETQGNKAGEEIKEKLLPAKLQSEILLKDGYCGLARYIQEKKLDR